MWARVGWCKHVSSEYIPCWRAESEAGLWRVSWSGSGEREGLNRAELGLWFGRVAATRLIGQHCLSTLRGTSGADRWGTNLNRRTSIRLWQAILVMRRIILSGGHPRRATSSNVAARQAPTARHCATVAWTRTLNPKGHNRIEYLANSAFNLVTCPAFSHPQPRAVAAASPQPLSLNMVRPKGQVDLQFTPRPQMSTPKLTTPVLQTPSASPPQLHPHTYDYTTMRPSSPRKASDLPRPRPFASTSDVGFRAGPAPAASASGSASGLPNNTTALNSHKQDEPPSPRRLKHGRTSSVPNLHKVSPGGGVGSGGLSHSRSRSWLAALLKPGERGLPTSPVPPLPSPSLARGQTPPSSPGKANKAHRGTFGGTLRRKVEEGASGLSSAFGAGERGRLEFGCAGGAGDEVEELVEDAPRRPRRPREELDQGEQNEYVLYQRITADHLYCFTDLIAIRLREDYSPARHSTYTPTSPRNRLSQQPSYSALMVPPPPPYTSLLQPAPATDPAQPSPRSHPSLTVLRGAQPQSRLRPRSAHRTEAVGLTREWKEALQAIPDASFEGSGRALASLLSELERADGGRGRVALSRSKRREAPVSPTDFDPHHPDDIHGDEPVVSARNLAVTRLQEPTGLTHSASFVSLSAFPSPPLAGAAGFIHPPSTKSLAERRAQLVAPLVFNPPSAFDDDDSPEPSAASAAEYTPEEERGRIVFSPYRTSSIVDYGGRYSIVVERECRTQGREENDESVDEGVSAAEDRLCAAGRLGANMMLGSHFSPITNSSTSSFEGSQNGSSGAQSAVDEATATLQMPDVGGLEIAGLSLKQLGVDRPSSLLPPAKYARPAPTLAHLEDDQDRRHLDFPPSSTFTAASFSPFSGSVASFSTNPSSLDGDREGHLTIPDNVKWRWERSGVFPSSAGSSVAASRSASGASSLAPAGAFGGERSVSGLSVLEYYAGEGDESLELDSSQRRWEEEMLRDHEARVKAAGRGAMREKSGGDDGEVAWGVAL